MCLGILYPPRYKHFSAVLPLALLAEFEATYERAGAGPFDARVIAEAFIRLFAVIGHQLQALNDKAGGGFEPTWYWRLHAQMTVQFDVFTAS